MPSHHLNDTELSSQSIFLHSNDAVVSITDAEKIFYLDQNIHAPAGYRLLIGLTNMTLPNTMYNITSANNAITFTGPVTKTIPEGNYSADALAEAVSTQMDTLGSCSFLSSNNIFQFTMNNSATQILSMTMKRPLGFKKATFPVSTITGSSTLFAPEVCDLGGVTNIYVRLRNLTFNNLDSRGRSTSIVASIVNNTNYGGYIFYTPPEVLYYLINESTISHLDIELTDQEGDVISLNGCDYNITFTVHYTKQRQAVAREGLLENIRRLHREKEQNGNDDKKNVSK